ncbi:Transmembrane and coiled-coil domain-containing 4 [Gossypium arboreum]|uniref:Transmembrane and coiled-coil domain-containing 4 n=1 Tax=Gossypium arboreum TaxID=29729 RepID=A0A0B0NE68_GOSAR|nr:Transmembrane and coiled-coil domain-containing 4 [Gossypium arboreum]KHG17468.1 Transmembrane and coiled-coil domain-containing 4 [Gossypium arboreum]
MEISLLSSTQKYAASALFALALHHSQLHQTRPTTRLLSLEEEPIGEGASNSSTISVSDFPHLWIHDNSGLLLPVFRFMEVEDQAWEGLKETAGVSTQARHHVGSFMTLLSETNDEVSSGIREKELALLKAVDATMLSMESSLVLSEDSDKNCDYETHCRQRCAYPDTTTATDPNGRIPRTAPNISNNEDVDGSGFRFFEKPIEEGKLLSEERKLTVLYELLSSCVADYVTDGGSKGYDARHRVALRLLATWLNVKWTKMEAMEIIVACNLIVRLKNEDAEQFGKIKNDKWKQAGIIGASALTGGSLVALTGGMGSLTPASIGLAAPVVGHGLGALAAILGSIVPAVGVVSSLEPLTYPLCIPAAGAGLAGSRTVIRIEDLDEFEFIQTGLYHNQGRLAVGILISGIAFEEEDFLRPWENYNDNLERYVLKWESKNLIALNAGITEWITSKVASNLLQGGAMLTVLSTLLAEEPLPAALLAASDLIDSAWAIAVDRPVTLIGFSLGARVILKCLQCLAETQGDNAGLVERVILLGAPIPIKDEKWEDARKMVAGRFVNVYHTNDWTLGIIFRARQEIGNIRTDQRDTRKRPSILYRPDGHSVTDYPCALYPQREGPSILYHPVGPSVKPSDINGYPLLKGNHLGITTFL